MSRTLTIEPSEHTYRGSTEAVAVYEHGEYEESSVLADQPKRTFVDEFETVEKAIEQYPEAEVLEHSTKIEPVFSDVPPSWFDPRDAGEEW